MREKFDPLSGQANRIGNNILKANKELEATRCWVREVVVGLNLCPFAAAPLKGERIRYVLTHEETAEGIYRALLSEMETLIGLPLSEVETSIFVVPRGLEDFADYLDLLDVAEGVIPEAGLDGVLQLASFHPEYCFDGSDMDDPANYTNRSPYPMFHLIREEPLAQALESYPDPEAIPKRNMALLRDLGLDAVRARLRACCSGD